jgi:protocatechuate 3,4-dioxygenase beta subunit
MSRSPAIVNAYHDTRAARPVAAAARAIAFVRQARPAGRARAILPAAISRRMPATIRSVSMPSTRRSILKLAGGAAGVGVAAVAGGAGWMAWKMREAPLGYALPDPGAASAALPPTPGCGGDGPTEAQTQGPYYTPNTPQRQVLREPGIPGKPLTVTGRVLTTGCTPLAGAVVDVWSCDGAGVYDNDGFRLRGHQFTDAEGRFRIETVKPSEYAQFGMRRTPHLHVKVQGRGTALLTTQLYFPGEPYNAEDGIFSESLLIDIAQDADDGVAGTFDFVLAKAV